MATPAQVTGERATRSWPPMVIHDISTHLAIESNDMLPHRVRGFVARWHCALGQEATSRSFSIFRYRLCRLRLLI